MAISFPNPAGQTPANTFSPSSTPSATTNGVTYVHDGDKWVAANPGKWDRTASTLSPLNAGDDLDLGAGDLSATKGTFSTGVLFGSDTAAANTLDDYETGTWTPSYTCSTTAPSINYNTQIGTYTKVGNLVTVGWRLRTTGTIASAGSGTVWVTNLPFTIGNTDFDQRGVAQIWSNGWSAGSNPNAALGRKGENNVNIAIQTSTNSAASDDLGGDFDNINQNAFDTSSGFHNQTYCTLTYWVD